MIWRITLRFVAAQLGDEGKSNSRRSEVEQASAGRGLVLARSKIHRLKPVPPKTHLIRTARDISAKILKKN
jgi:hypothetical protein